MVWRVIRRYFHFSLDFFNLSLNFFDFSFDFFLPHSYTCRQGLPRDSVIGFQFDRSINRRNRSVFVKIDWFSIFLSQISEVEFYTGFVTILSIFVIFAIPDRSSFWRRIDKWNPAAQLAASYPRHESSNQSHSLLNPSPDSPTASPLLSRATCGCWALPDPLWCFLASNLGGGSSRFG
jgi:hypothetical protein